jgi:hypothetical protein
MLPCFAGELALCSAAEGWVAPAKKDAGSAKKKKKGGADGQQPQNGQGPSNGGAAEAAEELDPEKAAKKVGGRMQV